MLRAVAVLAACAFHLGAAWAQPLPDKTRPDRVVTIRSNDAAMAAAIRQALAELDGFLALAEAPPPDTRGFSVKVRLPVSEDQSEYIWIEPFKRRGSGFVGIVANTPVSFSNLAAGDRLAFERKDIADWSYVQGGHTKGNYTTCALLASQTGSQREAMRQHYAQHCAE